MVGYIIIASHLEKMAASNGKENPRMRNLRIKTGVLKRIVKEKAMYEDEIRQYETKIADMKKEGKDEYTIKKKGELLQESQSMIPDCCRRIQTAYSDLETLMSEDWSGLTESQQYKAAQEILESTKEL